MVVSVIFHFISKGKGPFVNLRNKKKPWNRVGVTCFNLSETYVTTGTAYIYHNIEIC